MIHAIVKVPAEIERKASIYIGALMLMVAVVGFGSLAAPIVSGEVRSYLRQKKRQQLKLVSRVTFADYLGEEDPELAKIVPESRQYGVVIPKIGVNSKVLEQVDAEDKDKYLPALMQGLAQVAGSVNPGQKGDTYIFGHSTDFVWNIQKWNALFYDLVELEKGDKVYVYYRNKPYVYQVTGKGIYEPEDVSFLNPNNDKERLVLQTSWPRGTVLKRMILFAEPVNVGQLTYNIDK